MRCWWVPEGVPALEGLGRQCNVACEVHFITKHFNHAPSFFGVAPHVPWSPGPVSSGEVLGTFSGQRVLLPPSGTKDSVLNRTPSRACPGLGQQCGLNNHHTHSRHPSSVQVSPLQLRGLPIFLSVWNSLLFPTPKSLLFFNRELELYLFQKSISVLVSTFF